MESKIAIGIVRVMTSGTVLGQHFVNGCIFRVFVRDNDRSQQNEDDSYQDVWFWVHGFAYFVGTKSLTH